MTLFHFRRDYPRLNSIQHHIINNDSIPEMDALLDTNYTQNLQALVGQVLEQVIELVVLFVARDAFVESNDQLICLLNCKNSLGVHN